MACDIRFAAPMAPPFFRALLALDVLRLRRAALRLLGVYGRLLQVTLGPDQGRTNRGPTGLFLSLALLIRRLLLAPLLPAHSSEDIMRYLIAKHGHAFAHVRNHAALLLF